MAKGPTKGQKPPPKCKALLLCARAVTDPGTGTTDLFGVFDTVFARRLPAPSPPFTAFASLTDGHGDYRLAVEVYDLADGAQVAGADGPVASFPDRFSRQNLFINLPPLRLAHEGRYDFVLLADGQEVERTTFQVVMVKRGAGPTAG
jgi:hypothetical protein